MTAVDGLARRRPFRSRRVCGYRPSEGTDRTNKGTDRKDKGTDRTNKGTDRKDKGTDIRNRHSGHDWPKGA
jgi:hypothetical protein